MRDAKRVTRRLLQGGFCALLLRECIADFTMQGRNIFRPHSSTCGMKFPSEKRSPLGGKYSAPTFQHPRTPVGKDTCLTVEPKFKYIMKYYLYFLSVKMLQ